MSLQTIPSPSDPNRYGMGVRDAGRKGDWCETSTGGRFYAIDPRPEDYDLQDIVHSLSNMPRFGGHARRDHGNVYTVAQHSVAVANHILQFSPRKKNLAMYGLFHDASEAYLVDIPRPIKPELTNYKTIETGVQNAIYTKFCGTLPNEAQELVIKKADMALLFIEGYHLMPSKGVGWQDYEKYIDIAKSTAIDVWSHDYAEHMFKLTYEFLKV
jgi:hypothetical protein